MKQLKRLAVVVAGVAALAGFAGSSVASATILTSPAGTQVMAKAVFKGEKSEGLAVLENSFGEDVTCNGTTFAGEVSAEGSPVATVGIKLNTWTLTECNCEVVVLKSGTLEIHTEGANNNANGSVTGSDQEFTTNCFGFHCIWSTFNTPMGNLTAGAPATIAVNAIFKRTGGSSGTFCGGQGTFSARYKITVPSKLSVD